jgi:hypothetical protein
MKFESKMKMLEYIKSLSHEDKRVILKGYGYNPDQINSRNRLELIADYIVQGLHIGLKPIEAKSYANNMSDELVKIMPHLGKIEMEDNKTLTEVIANKVMSKLPKVTPDNVSVVKPIKAPKLRPVAKSSVSIGKVKHADYTIVFRSDRNGYEGWFGGKAEAFRPSVEKINSFFMKKYGQNGNLIIKNS